jgi:hypothetical protein
MILPAREAGDTLHIDKLRINHARVHYVSRYRDVWYAGVVNLSTSRSCGALPFMRPW